MKWKTLTFSILTKYLQLIPETSSFKSAIKNDKTNNIFASDR